MRDQNAIEKLRADVEAGWRQIEEGMVSEFDPEAVQCRGREKLAALRAVIREGLDSGPAEPFDIEEARASVLTEPKIDAALEAWRKERL